MKRPVALLLCLLICLAAVYTALAHSELVASKPAPGAQLAEAPAEIRLTFSEAVASGQIVLLGEGFQPVEGLATQHDAARPEELYAALPPLAPGTYTVQWTAASADGHEITGSYAFGVGPAAVREAGPSVVLWGMLALALALIAVVVLRKLLLGRKVGPD